MLSKMDRDLTAKLMGVVPAYQLAELIDSPEAEHTIIKNRRRQAASRILNEGVSALGTFALFNLREAPQLYAAALLGGIGLSAIEQSCQYEFHDAVLRPIRQKLTTLIPVMPLVNVEMASLGHKGVYAWSLWYRVNETETSQIGLSEGLALARPIIQGIAASREVPLPLVGLGVALSYLTIPIFAKLGEKKHKVNSREHLASEASDHAQFFTTGSLSDRVEDLRMKIKTARRKYDFLDIGLSRLDRFAFLVGSMVTNSEAIGMLNFMINLISTPTSYNGFIQKKKESKRGLAFVEDLYNIMSGRPYFLTDTSWDGYRAKKLQTQKNLEESKFEPGLHLRQMKAKIPDSREDLFAKPLTLDAMPGEIVWLLGESGTGKSVTTGKGLAGLVESRGEVIITDQNGQSRYLEEFKRKELNDRVWYVQPSFGFDDLRICDLYQERGLQCYLGLNNKQMADLSQSELLMTSLPDAFLERELYVLARDPKNSELVEKYPQYSNGSGMNTEGLVPSFPATMFEQIVTFRSQRNALVESHLVTKGANFQSIKATQEIGRLSTGMKTRFMWELTSEISGGSHEMRNGETRIIVLDEPFIGLDVVNVREYLKLINETTQGERPPVFILISHTHKELIHEILGSKVKTTEFESD